jgi:hypothetical protein
MRSATTRPFPAQLRFHSAFTSRRAYGKTSARAKASHKLWKACGFFGESALFLTR